MFVILFVIGNLFALKPFKLLAVPFVRDMIFYFIGVSWIFYLFCCIKCIRLFDAIGERLASFDSILTNLLAGLLVLYLIYVITVIVIGRFDKSPSSGFGHDGK